MMTKSYMKQLKKAIGGEYSGCKDMHALIETLEEAVKVIEAIEILGTHKWYVNKQPPSPKNWHKLFEKAVSFLERFENGK